MSFSVGRSPELTSIFKSRSNEAGVQHSSTQGKALFSQQKDTINLRKAALTGETQCSDNFTSKAASPSLLQSFKNLLAK